jgi:5-formyltetrahydrofolate cyclo-ligase
LATAVDQMSASKEALRNQMRAARDALDGALVRAASAAVCAQIAKLPAFARARTVSLYAALPGEIDCAELAAQLRARGGSTVYPRVARRSPPTLAFHLVRDARELGVGSLGIPTPPADAPAIALADVDLVIVPGLAFDSGGHRLGFGRGFYDAALGAAPRVVRVGVCHELQRIAAVPRRDHDQPVDILVTPAGARATGARPEILVEVP